MKSNVPSALHNRQGTYSRGQRSLIGMIAFQPVDTLAHELATGTGVVQQRLVDVELVSFGVDQRDRVVVQALLDDRGQARSTERHEPRCLGLDPLASGVE
jgi:hypothetical protein